MHFERDFAHIFQRAIARYQDAEATMGIPMHASSTHEVVLENYLDEEGYFSVDQFRQVSLPRSLSAAQRESQTDHALEILQDGVKAIFSLRNMLGGEYHLTADEVSSKMDRLLFKNLRTPPMMPFLRWLIFMMAYSNCCCLLILIACV
jgi:hypothetical protein